MKKLYNILLKSKYKLKCYYCEKSFTFEQDYRNGLTYQFNVSKYGKKYKIDGFEGINNMIKTFKIELDKLSEVLKYLGI